MKPIHIARALATHKAKQRATRLRVEIYMQMRSRVGTTSLQFKLAALGTKLRSFAFARESFLSHLISKVQAGASNLRHRGYHYRRGQSLPWGKVALVLLILGIVVFTGRALVRAVTPNASIDQRTAITPPYKTLELNREFTFPVRDENGEETDRKIHFILEKMELTKEIVAKGQRATAIAGRSFLLITIKLTNNEDIGIEIETRHYVRLSIDESEERLAADIHNDPVEVQPLSTKTTRIGVPVNNTLKKVTIFVGEIKGEKEAISIDL